MSDLHTIAAKMAGKSDGDWTEIKDTPLYHLAWAVMMSDADHWHDEEDTMIKMKREVGVIAERLKDEAGLRRMVAAVVVMVMRDAHEKHWDAYHGAPGGFLHRGDVRLDHDGKADTMINIINQLSQREEMPR
jgi:hypothetical protein